MRSISIAFDLPIARVRRWVPPAPGITPILLSGWPKTAKEIAARPPIAVRLAKEAVNRAFETSLRDGLEYERRLFYFLLATEDQKEGMRAFIEKRKPEWKGR